MGSLILPVDIAPQESLYYIGGITLEILKKNGTNMDFIDLFSELNKKLKVSVNLFVLVLDWLFLIEVAIVEKDGVVKLCS